MITLTPEQEKALQAVRDWYHDAQSPGNRYVPDPFRLFGCAGVGKTTLARHVGPKLGLRDVVFGAYTGKAASVLARKGVPATTIHSAIYRPMENAQARAEHRELTTRMADLMMEVGFTPSDEEAARIEDRIEELEAQLRQPGFVLNPESEWAYADLIVLDEVSMVNTDMARDIESFGVPVLVLGDPFQLPPIEGGGFYTRQEPDVLLTEIHRQALESPVLRLATEIRLAGQGYEPNQWETASITRAMEFEQVLCWRNATRWKLIERIRAKKGYPAGRVVAGDRVICLVNNKRDLGILNGQQFDVIKAGGPLDSSERALLLRECGTSGPDRWIEVYPEGFTGLEGEKALKSKRAWRGEVGAFTFADAITVHKAQGSEWDSVYVVDETRAMIEMQARRDGMAKATEEARRFLYTGVTRARESVQLARLKTG